MSSNNTPYLHAMRYWYNEFCKLKKDVKFWKRDKLSKFQRKHIVLQKISDNIRVMQQSLDSLVLIEAEQNGSYLDSLNLAILQCELVELKNRVDAGLDINW